jgi:hypothetical protein
MMISQTGILRDASTFPAMSYAQAGRERWMILSKHIATDRRRAWLLFTVIYRNKGAQWLLQGE